MVTDVIEKNKAGYTEESIVGRGLHNRVVGEGLAE